jgi:hypothetical protein
MKSSRVISHVIVELVFSVSKAFLSPSSEVDVMNVMFAHYIHTQNCHLSQPSWHGEWWAESDRQYCGTGLRRNAQLRPVTDGLVLRVWSMYCIPYECGKMCMLDRWDVPLGWDAMHTCCIHNYTNQRSQWWQMMATEMVSGTWNNSTLITPLCAATMEATNHI